MDAFQRGLSRPIPLEKAAAFFVGLKSWQPQTRENDELLAQAVKTAAAELAPAAPPAAHETPIQKRASLPDLSTVKNASLRFKLLAGLIKHADEESNHGGGSQLSSPTPAEVPPEQAYLEAEAAGRAAEEQNAVEYYQQQLESARAETQAAQEQAEQAMQQVQELEAQQAQHDSQVQVAQQEGQLAQRAALQQVQSANMSAAQAMQQAVDAENRALQAKGNEAAAKIQQQQTRSQLFDLASEGLPGTEPELGGEGDAAGGLAPAEAPAEAGGPEEAAGEEGAPAEGDPAATEGAEDPGAGGLNEAGEAASAEGMPGKEAPAEAAPAAAAPGAVPSAAPGSPPAPQAPSDGAAPAPESDPSAKRQGQVSIKVGNAGLNTELIEHVAKLAAGLPSFLQDPKVVGALAGGALGAGAAGIEASGHGPDLGALRGRVAEGEEAARQPGLKGFGRALELAKDKALLTLGEATQNHPVAATAAGGLMGASAGAAAGPRLAGLLRDAASLHKGAPGGA